MLEDVTWFPCEWCGQPLSDGDDVEAAIPDGTRAHVHRDCAARSALPWRLVSDLASEALAG